jgi:hypothetical protein
MAPRSQKRDLGHALGFFGRRTCKPNSVVCGHSSRRRVAASAQQRPTRRFRQWLEPPFAHRADTQPAWLFWRGFPPYLVLLRVGFTLPPSLPPERCALTAPFHPYPGFPGRYVFCGTGRLRALTPASRTLSGTLPYGVRTFLSRSACCRVRPGSDRPVLLPSNSLQGSGVRDQTWDSGAWLCG